VSWLTNKELVGFCIPIHCSESAAEVVNICNVYEFVKGDAATSMVGCVVLFVFLLLLLLALLLHVIFIALTHMLLLVVTGIGHLEGEELCM
jgi:hypothetical protein